MVEGPPAPLYHDEATQGTGRGTRRLAVDKTPPHLLRLFLSDARVAGVRLTFSGRPVGPLTLVRPIVAKILKRERSSLAGPLKPFCRAIKARSRKDVMGEIKAAPGRQNALTLVGQTPSQGLPPLDTGELVGWPPILLTSLLAYLVRASGFAYALGLRLDGSGHRDENPDRDLSAGPADREALFHRVSVLKPSFRSSLSAAVGSRRTFSPRFLPFGGPFSTVSSSAGLFFRARHSAAPGGLPRKCRNTYRSRCSTSSFYILAFPGWQALNGPSNRTPYRGPNISRFRPS